MAATVEYLCSCCGDVHRGLPAWHFDAPVQVAAIPVAERTERVELTTDACVIGGIDQPQFYAKGLLEIPVIGESEPFVWGIWLSLSEDSMLRYGELFEDHQRDAGESFFGWVCNSIPGYPETQLLKARLHVRTYPQRPWIELEPTEHRLALDQRRGITREHAISLAERLLHAGQGRSPSASRPAGYYER